MSLAEQYLQFQVILKELTDTKIDNRLVEK